MHTITRRRWAARWPWAVAALVQLLASAKLGAQQTAPPVRTIEPRFTRIFGSDSLHIESSAALSPDGRWIVFVNEEGPQAYNLWVVSTRGGDPIRLTTGRHSDSWPEFLPSGDRIAFVSDRPSSADNPQTPLMTIAFDPSSGRAAGPPRQVSLESVVRRFTISPDGREIAYLTRRGSVHRVLVVPASGGTPRSVAEFSGSIGMLGSLQWSADGQWIYFFVRPQGQGTRRLMRVSAAGGTPQELGGGFPQSPPASSPISPDGRYHLVHVEHGPEGPEPEQLYEIAATQGGTIARFALHRRMRPWGFTPDGRGLVTTRNDVVAPIRVVPVRGGPVRQLTEAREYDWPMGWNADGSEVLVQTRSNGHGTLMAVPLGGGPAREWRLPEEARGSMVASRDTRLLEYAVGDDPAARRLVVRRLDDGQTRQLTAASYSVPQLGAIGAGGTYNLTAAGEFLYFERSGSRLELWAAAPEGRPRMLRAFPISLAGRGWIGVHGDRVAWVERRSDSTALYVAEGRSGPARHLVTVAGEASTPTWSHGGRWIAMSHYLTNQPHGVLIVRVGANGTLAAPPRILPSGAMWAWKIQWLPNDEAVTVLGMTGAGSETHVFLVPLREGERPVAITRDDPSLKWGYELSPDGRYVAYPAEIPRGSSIWLVDLGEVLAPANDRGSGGRR